MPERSASTAGNNQVAAIDSIDALLEAAPAISGLDDLDGTDPLDVDAFGDDVEVVDDDTEIPEEYITAPPLPPPSEVKRGLSSRPPVPYKPVPKVALRDQADAPAVPMPRPPKPAAQIASAPPAAAPAPEPDLPPRPPIQVEPARIIIQPPRQLSLLEQLVADAAAGKPAQPQLSWEEQRACSRSAPIASFKVTPEMVSLYHQALRNHHAHTVWVPGFGSQLGDWLFSVFRKTYPDRTYHRHPRLYREHKGVVFEYVWTGWYWSHPQASGLVVWEMTRTPEVGIHRMMLIDPMCLY